MLTVFGNPIALAKLPEGYANAEAFVNDSTNYHSVAGGKPILCLPRNCIIDAIDIQRAGEENIVKVFWPSEDAGYTYSLNMNNLTLKLASDGGKRVLKVMKSREMTEKQ